MSNKDDLDDTSAPLIEAVSAAMTLEPGDLLLTGTPEGVGPLAAGDEVEIEIDQVGVLVFSVDEEFS